jgi:hypothetical protein
VRHAYDALAERFSTRLPTSTEEKVALLVDDDEPTVFEEAPAVAPVDTGLSKIVALDDVTMERAALDDEGTPIEGVAAPPGPVTVETSFVAGEIDVPARTPDPDTGSARR